MRSVISRPANVKTATGIIARTRKCSTTCIPTNRATSQPAVTNNNNANPDATGKIFVLLSCSREDLLPKALARGQVTDSLLSLRVVSPLGEPLYTSPVAYDTRYAATESLNAQHGDLRVQAAVRPDAAGSFIIGGLPGSRVPLLVALMLLTLGVGVALSLTRRNGV